MLDKFEGSQECDIWRSWLGAKAKRPAPVMFEMVEIWKNRLKYGFRLGEKVSHLRMQLRQNKSVNINNCQSERENHNNKTARENVLPAETFLKLATKCLRCKHAREIRHTTGFVRMLKNRIVNQNVAQRWLKTNHVAVRGTSMALKGSMLIAEHRNVCTHVLLVANDHQGSPKVLTNRNVGRTVERQSRLCIS